MNNDQQTVPDQCPACGRVSQDWRTRQFEGAKGVQLEGGINRAEPYILRRRTIGTPYIALDVDQVEWRQINGVMTPVAVIELTRVDGTMAVPQSYLDNILERMGERDFQREHAVSVAAALRVPAYVVLFRWDLSELWGYNLTLSRGWKHWASWDKYVAWLRGLGQNPVKPLDP